MQKLPTSLNRFFWHFLKPHKWLVMTLFCTGLVWSIHFSVGPYLLKLIIDGLASYEGDVSQIFDVVKWPAILYMIAWSIMAINFRIADFIKLRLFPNIRRDIINAMFAYLNKHSFSFLQNNFAGSLSAKIMDMSGSTVSAFTKAEEAIANIVAFLIALGVIYTVNPLFSMILLIWSITFTTITVFFARRTKLLSEIFSESKATLSGKIIDVVGNLMNTRLFARNRYESKRLLKAISDTVEKDRAVQWYVLKMRMFWDVTFVLLISSVLFSLLNMFSKGEITVGDFTFIMTVSLNIFMHVWHLASQLIQFSEDLGKCSQALTIARAPHEITDIKDAPDLKVKKGKITFDNVTFAYNQDKNVFENQSLTIKAGSKVGLVGYSGSGKTTFINLILRLFDANEGRILIDGQDISKVTQDSLREQISLIPQDNSLFHRSLMENIRYGKLSASDKDVIRASKAVHCHEFVNELPEGYDSLVGERGVKLSGGQRQRISIARAFLKNAPILMLDEATSALDSVTEKFIQAGLQKLMQGRTTIVIAHRLSTLTEMDRILVFNKGKLIEDGTHKQLIKKRGGHYANMWRMQTEGFLPD